MGKNQGDLGFGDEFLDTTSKKKNQSMKEIKNDKLDH